MENFAIALKKEAENTSKAERDYLNQFIPVFFNCWNKNSLLLMLGVEDKTILRNVVGENADFIIEDSAKYLIHISKVSDAKKQVRFAFRELDYSFEQKEHLREFFRFHGKLTPEIDNQLNNGRLTDTLNLNESIEKICASNKSLIEILSGEELIDAVYIDTPFISDSNFLQFVKDIFIIPCKYRHLSVQSAERNNAAITETFWEYINVNNISSLIHNPHCYNFVLLNSKNDDVFRIFRELIEIYVKDFNLKDTSTEHLLKRIFFVCDDIFNPTNPDSESRGIENMSDYDIQLMNIIGMNPDKLMSASMNAELYLALLKIFNYYDLRHKECENSLPSLLQCALDYVNSMECTIARRCESLIKDFDDFPATYAEIEESLTKLSQDNKPLENRNIVLQTLETNLTKMAAFIGIYSPQCKPEIDKIALDLNDTKDDFLKKHKIGRKEFGNTKNKSEFKAFISRITSELLGVLESVKTQVSIPSQKLLLDTISDSSEYNDKLSYIKNEIPNTGDNDTISIARYSTIANLQRLFETESHYMSVINQQLTYEVLMSKEKRHISELNNAISEIRKRIQYTSALISEYLSDLKKQKAYSDSIVKTMLLNEAYTELNGINS